jgi:hypothetical protein
MANLAQAAHGLEPAEDLFDPLALGLTDSIAAMAAGPLVDRTVLLLCDMRGNVVIALLAHELLAVIALVRPQSYTPQAAISSTISSAALGSALPWA